MSVPAPKTLIVGLSGPSSSGKTTLARLLREAFNGSSSVSLFIVHEDDFYKTDVDIPYREWHSPIHGARREQDWDCVESLDLPLLSRVLTHVKKTGYLPSDFASKEDKNSVGETGVSEQEILYARQSVKNWLDLLSSSSSSSSSSSGLAEKGESAQELRICILEGFLLFPPLTEYLSSRSDEFASTSPAQLEELGRLVDQTIDLRLFLPCSRDLTITRRARRSGYVTLEGFWADPPAYVEELVWPNYVRDHGWLFDGSKEDADAGNVNKQNADARSVNVGPGKGDQGMTTVFAWGVDVFKKAIERMLDDSKKD